jgi:hypothetical protein
LKDFQCEKQEERVGKTLHSFTMSDNKQKSNFDKRGDARERAYSISKDFFFTCTDGIKTGATGDRS